jgi:hypothetical protein
MMADCPNICVNSWLIIISENPRNPRLNYSCQFVVNLIHFLFFGPLLQKSFCLLALTQDATDVVDADLVVRVR